MSYLQIRNGQTLPFSQVPCLPFSDFRALTVEAITGGQRACSFFAMPNPAGSESGLAHLLVAVLASNIKRQLSVLTTTVGASFQSLTPDCPQFHMFEREIAEQWGIVPLGHPWLRPVRFHNPWNGAAPVWPADSAQLFHIAGGEAHEVAVGPVHAGVIEPGHFRFQCHGEVVFHLEISLGYQHRGIERELTGGPFKKSPFQIEALAGDTTIGHYLAWCHNFEALQKIPVPPRAEALRAVALELERLANHTGDLGALGGDVGYLPTSSYCGRIRGDFLNMTAMLCGSRLGRGLLCPGGVRFDLDSPARIEKLQKALVNAAADTQTAIQLLWDSPSVMSRFENTGRVTREAAIELGLVGPAARASGIDNDTRRDFPGGHPLPEYFPGQPPHESMTGDVAARALVRWHELKKSLQFLLELVPALPAGPSRSRLPADKTPDCQPDALVVSLVEGWRGEICHTAITDSQGRLARYKVVDPSFHNWIGLGMALRHQEISDFPLCNKSFSLSYCGFDL